MLPPTAASNLILSLLASMLAGGVVGVERTYNGRPAGFRTMALVCFTSCLLMGISTYPSLWRHAGEVLGMMDPTRVVQGILTGVGFIGGGVIVKDGWNVRGLTTAATIWVVSGIGILLGCAMYLESAVATALTLGILSGFRKLEMLIPKSQYLHASLTYKQEDVPNEESLVEQLVAVGFSVKDVSYGYDKADGSFEYQLTLCTSQRGARACLAKKLLAMNDLLRFNLAQSKE